MDELFRARNSMVECSAHNGNVVGSIPTVPRVHRYVTDGMKGYISDGER